MLFSVEPIDLGTKTTVAVYKQLGIGRIVTTTIQNSYQLVLDGDQQGYKRLWTQLLDKTAKKKRTSAEWEAQTVLPRLDEPFDFTIRTNLDEFKIIDMDTTIISILQNPQIPSFFSGTTYPRKTGWNELKIEKDSSTIFPYYIFDSSAWKSLDISQKIAANKKRVQA